jgi:hypothetical protein
MMRLRISEMADAATMAQTPANSNCPPATIQTTEPTQSGVAQSQIGFPGVVMFLKVLAEWRLRHCDSLNPGRGL